MLANAVGPHAQEPARLSASCNGAGLQLSWPATAQRADGSVERPYFELQRFVDLQRWEPVGERQRSLGASLGQMLSVTQPLDGSKAFLHAGSKKEFRNLEALFL